MCVDLIIIKIACFRHFFTFFGDFPRFSIFGKFSKRLFRPRAQISANGFFDNVRKFLQIMLACSQLHTWWKEFSGRKIIFCAPCYKIWIKFKNKYNFFLIIVLIHQGSQNVCEKTYC